MDSAFGKYAFQRKTQNPEQYEKKILPNGPTLYKMKKPFWIRIILAHDRKYGEGKKEKRNYPQSSGSYH